MGNSPFPVPDPTTPWWRTELHELENHRTTEQLPNEADTVIIGAGYAGVSIAYHLLEKQRETNEDTSILILEARGACSGATGRNGGHMKPDPFTRAAQVLSTHGTEAANEVSSFETRHLTEIARLVKKEKIDCDFVLTRTTDVCLDDEGGRSIEDKINALEAAGVIGIDDIFHSSESTAEGVGPCSSSTRMGNADLSRSLESKKQRVQQPM